MVDQDRDYLSQSPDEKPHTEQPQWRQDFPIDVPQDNYVSRREFTKFLVLISAAFAAGQSWIVYENWRRQKRGLPPMMKVAEVKDVPVGGSLVFHYPQESEPCLLLRVGPGVNIGDGKKDFVAYGQKCTHLSCAVIPEMKEKKLVCPCHHGYFDMEDGRVLAGPPPRPLPRVKLEIRDGAIYATGVELRTA